MANKISQNYKIVETSRKTIHTLDFNDGTYKNLYNRIISCLSKAQSARTKVSLTNSFRSKLSFGND